MSTQGPQLVAQPSLAETSFHVPLHEFMSRHRGEILEACRSRLSESVADNETLNDDVRNFFDEVYRATKRDSGFAETHSPLPGYSPTAARIGLQPRRLGLEPVKVPEIFAALAEAIGEIGARYELSIGAEEYRILQRCMDAGIAASIEKFWANEQLLEKRRITEKFGYFAHELRNSLGNAALAFELLRTGCVTIDGRTGDVLAKNLARMEALVTRTITSVRLDVGAPLALRPLKVSALLRELQASAAPERAMSVALEVDESIHVQADEMLLSSAIGNLLHNALKFSRDGAHIAVRCHADEGCVLIEVEDECGGLTEECELTLFQSYVTSGESRKSLGLGLSITQQAMAAMGGTVAFRNLPGHGCIFTLRMEHGAPSVSKTRG